MIPTSDPDEGMRAKYDAKAKTLSWTEADSDSTSITMTKKSSSGSGDSNNNGGSTGNGTPVADPKVGDLGVNITTPVLPASVGESFLAGKTYSGEEQDKITFNADGTGTYQMWESSVGYTYWKIRYSYDNTNKILSLYPTEIKGPDGEYHDFAYYKNQYENQTITEAIKGFETNVIHNSSPSGKLNYNKSTMVTFASKMLPNEPVTTSDSDEKIVRAYQKGLLKNCYAVYFGNVQNYYLKNSGNSFVAYADYEHSEPEAFRAFHMTPRVYSIDPTVELRMETQDGYRFYRLKLQINSAECNYVVKEITNSYIEVMFIPNSWQKTDPYFTEENPKIPYSIVTPTDEYLSTCRNKVLKLTINGTDYELVYGDSMGLTKQ